MLPFDFTDDATRDIPEWDPSVHAIFIGFSNDISPYEPITFAFGFTQAIHDETKPKVDLDV